MFVIMQPGVSEDQVARVRKRLEALGYQIRRLDGEQQTMLYPLNSPAVDIDPRDIEVLPGVFEVRRLVRPYKLVDRVGCPGGTAVDVGSVRIGGDELVVIAGPCAVESREQISRAAAEVRAAGGHILRGGAFKPRSSPYAFQGLGQEGLRYLREAADNQGMPCVTEVVDSSEVELVGKYADMLQVGARNMQNFRLLTALGAINQPVLLKRGLAATLEELLLAAEYIVASGNPRVVLCERGVRTFEPSARAIMDINAIVALRRLTHLPILADPSHAAGLRQYVAPLARAAVAAGADGIMVEVHPEPDSARSDGAQSLEPSGFRALISDLRSIAPAIGRRLSGPA